MTIVLYMQVYQKLVLNPEHSFNTKATLMWFFFMLNPQQSSTVRAFQCSNVKTYFDTSTSEIWQLNHKSWTQIILFTLIYIYKKRFTMHLVTFCCLPFKLTDFLFNIHLKRMCSCILVCMMYCYFWGCGNTSFIYFRWCVIHQNGFQVFPGSVPLHFV